MNDSRPPGPDSGTWPYGIGIIGAGTIVCAAHLPAYAKANFPVRRIYDTDSRKAGEAAEKFGIGAATRLEDVLEDPDIAILDVAIPPDRQEELFPQLVASGKHLLCQKPLATSWESAERMVESARLRGVRLAVNQQMRWEPVIASAAERLKSGQLGEPLSVVIDVAIDTPGHSWPDAAQLDLLLHSIHYFDSIRVLLGMPEYVYCSLAKFPDDGALGETRSYSIFEYAGWKRAVIAVSHGNWSQPAIAEFRLEGTRGMLKGRFGLFDDYPRCRSDDIAYAGRAPEGGSPWEKQVSAERWIPDAFVHSMGELQRAIRDDREPVHSGRDVLDTMRLVYAAYRSHAEKRAVSPGEIGA